MSTASEASRNVYHRLARAGFGFEITYQQRNLLYLYYGEKLGILVYKC